MCTKYIFNMINYSHSLYFVCCLFQARKNLITVAAAENGGVNARNMKVVT